MPSAASKNDDDAPGRSSDVDETSGVVPRRAVGCGDSTAEITLCNDGIECVTSAARCEQGFRSDSDPYGPYAPGEVIAGKYRLIKLLSSGGMGSVWVAHNLLLDVDIAIKLIRPDIKADTLVERFMEEARLAARIEHAAIVTIFDLGYTERGDPFIVMELLRGEDLRESLSRERQLGAVQTVQLLLPIADALATAHAKGVVHRDLKPENVFIASLEDKLQPKLLDFGIAKPTSPTKRRLTRAGTVMGSPEYMSPEQAIGQDDVDHRADVWSFCVVLYECLSGRPPFSAGNYEAVLREITDRPVVPIMELGVGDPKLWAIIERGLAKDREQRWNSMRDLGRALAQWLIARFVDEDVCGRSLRASWLRETELGLRGLQPTAAGAPNLVRVRSHLRCEAPTLAGGVATLDRKTFKRSGNGLRTLGRYAIVGVAMLVSGWWALGAPWTFALKPAEPAQTTLPEAVPMAARGVTNLSLQRMELETAPTAASPAPPPGPESSPESLRPTARETAPPARRAQRGHNAERSRSITDTLRDRPRSRQTDRPRLPAPQKAKTSAQLEFGF